ncbi:hypothetical protein [Tumebacillus permanentifrigoris]|uniref:Uncharacterized protein n=1 Tax=Tumebacillus permanentifrigoris TaxID=378543 RepID=A0A316DET7_9BACL|nr:hypothetical protein [Tumebacillus permanentifrigoris]PWK16475.1 hypothetical protein C7459_101339 [Tumebacillus permanentifrigoris]
MKLEKVTLHFDMSDSKTSTQDLRALLEYLSGEVESVDVEIEESNEQAVKAEYYEQNGVVDSKQVRLLKELQAGLTERQAPVFDYFIKNPGIHSAEELKRAFPDLRGLGKLPGVFRAKHRYVALGGNEFGCPFVQVSWNHELGCGNYRGLSKAEAKALL